MNTKSVMLVILTCIFFLFDSIRQGQCQVIERILSQRDIASVRERVHELMKSHPDAPGILYLQAVIESDGKKSIELYNQLLLTHPTSGYADDARFKIAQYQYAFGRYHTARKKFQELVSKHPDSPLRDDAAYFAARCLFALADEINGDQELRAFINIYPDSPLKNLAELDLKAYNRSANFSGRKNRRRSGFHSDNPPALQKDTILENQPIEAKEKNSESDHSSNRYMLQIGAFSNQTNAFNQKRYFENKGYKVDVVRKNVNGKTLYAVFLSQFSSREAAEKLGNQLKTKYRINYVIVEVP